jgi:hypothetical protein
MNLLELTSPYGQAKTLLLSDRAAKLKQAAQDVMQVSAKTPLLPLAGAAIGGPAGGALGEGARQMVDIARGEPAPSPMSSAFQMAGASLVPSVGKGAKAGVELGKKAVNIAFAPSRFKAGLQLGKVEEAAGIAQEVLEKPTAEGVRSIVKKILPAKNPVKLEAAYQEMGKQNPQGLKDLHDVIRGALDASSPRALAQTLQPKILTKAGRARLAANEEAARKALNAIVPGREEAAQKVANAITRDELLKGVMKKGKKAAIAAAIGGAGLGGLRTLVQ